MKNILNLLGLFTLLILLVVRCNKESKPKVEGEPPSIINVEKRDRRDMKLLVGDKDTLLLNVIIDKNVTANWEVITYNQNDNFMDKSGILELGATSGILELGATSGILEADSTLVKIPMAAVAAGRTTVEFKVVDSRKVPYGITFFLSISG